MDASHRTLCDPPRRQVDETAALDPAHHAEGPITDQPVHEPVDIAAKPAALAERQIVEPAELEDVRDISRIPRVANHEHRSPVSLPRAHLLVAEGIVGLELETLRHPAADLQLQRVVVGLGDVRGQVCAPDQIGIRQEEVRWIAGTRGVVALAGVAVQVGREAERVRVEHRERRQVGVVRPEVR